MKTRFAPSPTGRMHMGSVRTALFNFLAAKNAGGTFLLRIEDTDAVRSKEEYTHSLIDDLNSLFLKCDEGAGVGGNLGPYYQSERQGVYDQYYHTLEKNGRAYPCFCSEEQLALKRKVQISSGQPPRYARTCLKLTTEEIQERLEKSMEYTLRFRVPDDEYILFHDLVHGDMKFNSSDIGDFIIRRRDGKAPFLFCNAIDDALMGVTHAIRGEDHLSNTPSQLMVLKALGLNAPHYGHISLIVNSEGHKLSKREDDQSSQEMLQKGYLPLAILNYFARLGHSYAENHFMSLPELWEHFSFSRLSHSPAHFDPAQLQVRQKEAVLRLTAQEFWHWIEAVCSELIPHDKRDLFCATIQPNVILPAEAKEWAMIFFSEAPQVDSTSIPHDFCTTLLAAVEQHGLDYAAVVGVLKEKGFKGKELFQPLRLVTTSVLHGPELESIFKLIGKEELMRRAKRFI